MSRTAIKCSCGQRIGQKDVMQTGYYMRMFGPNFVYVKFRCSRCKKLGEQFVKQEEWEDGILKENMAEVSAVEKQQFASMGPIQMREMVDFHQALEQEDTLSALSREFGQSASDEAKDR